MDRPAAPGPPPDIYGPPPASVEESRPLGLVFLLGVVVGSTAALLLTSDDEDARSAPMPVRRLLRRRKAEPASLGEVVRREAIHVAESVLRDVGQVASRWVLEALAAEPSETEDEEPLEAGAGPQDRG